MRLRNFRTPESLSIFQRTALEFCRMIPVWKTPDVSAVLVRTPRLRLSIEYSRLLSAPDQQSNRTYACDRDRIQRETDASSALRAHTTGRDIGDRARSRV